MLSVPEGPKDRYFGKKQRPNSTAAARSVTAGRRAANRAAAAVEAKKQAEVSKVKKMASKAKRHNAGELVSQPASSGSASASSRQREKRKRKFNSKYQRWSVNKKILKFLTKSNKIFWILTNLTKNNYSRISHNRAFSEYFANTVLEKAAASNTVGGSRKC